MPSTDATVGFLLGRLARERRVPRATLRVAPGRWRGFGGGYALAVTDGLLWLAQPQPFGGPSIASVALPEVSGAELRTVRAFGPFGGPQLVRLRIGVGNRMLRFVALDDLETCRAFVRTLTGE